MSRVLLHSLVFAPDGVSTAYIMAELAIELRHLGHQVTVLTSTPHYNVGGAALARQALRRRAFGLWYRSDLDGIPVWHVTLPPKGERVWIRVFDFLRFHAVSLLISLRSIGHQDVVISTSPPLSIGLLSWLLGVRWRAPSIYKVAELYPDLAIRQGVLRGRLAIGLAKALERFVYAKNAMIVTIADQFRSTICNRGVPGHKVRTIPDCVDVEMYRPLPKRNQFSVEYGLLDDFVVLYGGNIGFFQDWDSVLYAAQELAYLPIRFIIVGDGGRRAWLAGEVERRGLLNVRLLGYQPKSRMPEINASCDIAMIPLTVPGSKDGFPSKIYSNLACGRPVIVSASEASEMATLVTGAGCGRAVPPEDGPAFAEAVRKAYEEREQLADEGHRGRLLVERDYSKESVAKRYDAVVRELTHQ